MTVLETLRQARAILAGPEDWCQGESRPYDHPLSLFQALANAGDSCGLAYSALRERAKGIGFHTLSFWCDAPGRTFAEVANLLEELERTAGKKGGAR